MQQGSGTHNECPLRTLPQIQILLACATANTFWSCHPPLAAPLHQCPLHFDPSLTNAQEVIQGAPPKRPQKQKPSVAAECTPHVGHPLA